MKGACSGHSVRKSMRADSGGVPDQVNLTCDHRIVYGAQAAEFLVTLKAVIEDPDQLTL